MAMMAILACLLCAVLAAPAPITFTYTVLNSMRRHVLLWRAHICRRRLPHKNLG